MIPGWSVVGQTPCSIGTQRPAGKFGLIATWFDDPGADAEGSQFVLQRFGQPFHGEFRSVVQGGKWEGNPPAHGGHIDDHPRPVRPHSGQNGLGDGDQPEEVDLQLLQESLRRMPPQAAPSGAVAGIVDEDVDATKGIHRRFDGGCDRDLIGHIELCQQ